MSPASMTGKSAWDLLQRPARPHQGRQVLHSEPMTTDARLAARLARLNGDRVEALHAVQRLTGARKAMAPQLAARSWAHAGARAPARCGDDVFNGRLETQ